MKEPRVTIGLPVYNGEKQLPAALDSLLGQSFTDFRIVICDNASTDRTPEIGRAYAEKDERVIYRCNESNIGASPNFELALSIADTEFFMWAAHDDLWSPHLLERCVAALDDNDDAGFAFPEFTLRSIKWRREGGMPKGMFDYVASQDRRRRVLTHINTHPYSHKGNLVYSVFRTDLLKKSLEGQVIGTMIVATVILGQYRGIPVNGPLFYKCYWDMWPRMKKWKWVRTAKRLEYNRSRDKTFEGLCGEYPEYKNDILRICEKMRINRCLKNYRIVEQSELSL